VKTCAARRVVGGPQAAVMRCNDGTTDGQSHTGPVSLRGKKRIEDLVRLLRGQPYAGVADGDHKLLVFRSPRLDGKLARPIHILHCINAVTDEVGTRELAIKSQRAKNEQLMVSVSDTGVGLPPQQ